MTTDTEQPPTAEQMQAVVRTAPINDRFLAESGWLRPNQHVKVIRDMNGTNLRGASMKSKNYRPPCLADIVSEDPHEFESHGYFRVALPEASASGSAVSTNLRLVWFPEPNYHTRNPMPSPVRRIGSVAKSQPHRCMGA